MDRTLTRGRLLNVFFSMMVDEVNGMVARHEIREKIEEALDSIGRDKRETWGTSRAAQRALRDAVGGMRRPDVLPGTLPGPVLIEDDE